MVRQLVPEPNKPCKMTSAGPCRDLCAEIQMLFLPLSASRAELTFLGHVQVGMVPCSISAAKFIVSDKVGCGCMVRPKSSASAPISEQGLSLRSNRPRARRQCLRR